MTLFQPSKTNDWFLHETQYWAEMGFAKNLNFKLTPPNTKNINHLSANPTKWEKTHLLAVGSF